MIVFLCSLSGAVLWCVRWVAIAAAQCDRRAGTDAKPQGTSEGIKTDDTCDPIACNECNKGAGKARQETGNQTDDEHAWLSLWALSVQAR